MAATEKKILRSIHDLPDWYDFKKYLGLKYLNSAAWYELLLQRHAHINYLESYGVKNIENERYIYANTLKKSQNNPLYLTDGNLEIYTYGGGKLDALKNDTNYFNDMALGISPITLMQLYQIECWYGEKTKTRARNWIDRVFNENMTRNLEEERETSFIKSFIHEPISKSLKTHGNPSIYDSSNEMSKRGAKFVEIDFALPDTALIKQFKQLLKDYRQNFPDTPKPEKYKYPDFNKWIEFGILQYLDLKIWQLQTGKQIPNRVMADAIYPNGDKGEDTVRKTTKDTAKTVMSLEYLNFFSAIVAEENRK